MYKRLKKSIIEKPQHFLAGAVLIILLFTRLRIGDFGNISDEASIGLLALSGVVLALHKYYYEKEKDRKVETVDLITFFRKEVLIASEKLNLEITNNKQPFIRIALDVDTKEEMISKHPDDFKRQVTSLTTGDAFNKVVSMANALEEFSARVLILSSESEPSLRILHDSYIKLVESVSSFMVHDKRESQDRNFINSIKLYNFWNKF